VGLAGSPKLILVVSAVSTVLIQNTGVLWTLVVSNRPHEIVVLRYHIVATIAGLLTTWLISLTWWSHSSVLHAQGAVVVWALASLVHALHVLRNDVILASLRWMLIHLSQWILRLQRSLSFGLGFGALWRHTSIECLELCIAHLISSHSTHVV